MLIMRKAELLSIQIDEMKKEILTLRELLKAKNEFIGMQQNKINDLERQNRILTNKVDNLQSRQEGMVISYG